jgi:hypothetical protein
MNLTITPGAGDGPDRPLGSLLRLRSDHRVGIGTNQGDWFVSNGTGLRSLKTAIEFVGNRHADLVTPFEVRDRRPAVGDKVVAQLRWEHDGLRGIWAIGTVTSVVVNELYVDVESCETPITDVRNRAARRWAPFDPSGNDAFSVGDRVRVTGGGWSFVGETGRVTSVDGSGRGVVLDVPRDPSLSGHVWNISQVHLESVDGPTGPLNIVIGGRYKLLPGATATRSNGEAGGYVSSTFTGGIAEVEVIRTDAPHGDDVAVQLIGRNASNWVRREFLAPLDTDSTTPAPAEAVRTPWTGSHDKYSMFVKGNEVEFTVQARLSANGEQWIVGCKSPTIKDVQPFVQKIERTDPGWNLTVRAIVEENEWDEASIKVGGVALIDNGDFADYAHDAKLISTLVTPEPVKAPEPEKTITVTLTENEAHALFVVRGIISGPDGSDKPRGLFNSASNKLQAALGLRTGSFTAAQSKYYSQIGGSIGFTDDEPF